MPIKRFLTGLVLATFAAGLLAGCSTNIDIGTPSKVTTNEDKKQVVVYDLGLDGEQKIFQSSASVIVVSNTDSAAYNTANISISQETVDVCVKLLRSDAIQEELFEEYPDVKHKMVLETRNGTGVFTIIVTGQEPQCLEELCNMMASRLCENLPDELEDIDCKIVDKATPARLITTG